MPHAEVYRAGAVRKPVVHVCVCVCVYVCACIAAISVIDLSVLLYILHISDAHEITDARTEQSGS